MNMMKKTAAPSSNLLFPSLLVLGLLCAGVNVVAQNDCTSAPPTGTCPSPASPILTWCAGNNAASACPGGTSWTGFHTSPPAAGSWTDQFEGLDAASIRKNATTFRPQADANGAVGPTDANGVGQYLEFAGDFVQAFDRSTGTGIFSSKANSGGAPQSITGLFYPGGASYCASASLDGIASYDRLDSVFVVGNLFNPGSKGAYYLCMGVSAASGSVPANNLQGSSGASHWNVYAYNITPAIPRNPAGGTYFPDYLRYGTWSDGFYVEWDLEDIPNKYNIVGFEVCKLDKTNMIAGLAAGAPQCYTYIPSYVTGVGGTDTSLIHTLLPADFEGENGVPSNTAGEYFLAQVNPNNPGTNDQCTTAPCTSDVLAFWTWTGFTTGAGPTLITLKQPYTPGCYDPAHPYNTVCVPEPYGGPIDSLGDRLLYRLAYRYITNGSSGTEYLAVGQTVEESSNTGRTGVRYYQFAASANPTVVLQGDIEDLTYHMFTSVPSVAMDKNGDLGVEFTVTGNTSHGSAENYDPSPYFITISASGKIGQPVAVLKDSGSSGQDETDGYWGEYVSVASDPNDDLTFWATNQYMNGTQSSECGSKSQAGCTWASRVYVCKKGSGC